ncbi:VOC family protein [Paenibacillus sp. strain BS8-2]
MDYIVKGLANICIHTKDMEKSIRFYTEILGFDDYYQYVLKNGTLNGMQFKFLRAGSCILMLVKPADLSWVQDLGNTNGDHFALEVHGIDAIVEVVKSAGYAIEEEAPIGIPDFFPSGRRTIHIKGPNNERIGLVEYGYNQL